MRQAHVADFTGFDIEFDNYGSTNSPETREYCGEIWAALRKAGLIEGRKVTQLYDAKIGTFLADRFVKGTCPKCQSPGQYGDSCEKCGTHYDADRAGRSGEHAVEHEAGGPRGGPLVRQHREAARVPGRVDASGGAYSRKSPTICTAISSASRCTIGTSRGRRPTSASRFPTARATTGTSGSTPRSATWARRCSGASGSGEQFDDWWRSPETEIHHFIGKDITYFHTLFWPAMLHVAGFNLPKKVHIHGFLTVNGEKMSKSKGTFIRASTYLKHLDPSYLRYYYASKLSSAVDDIDLNFEDFISKVNSDLVGKVVNIASRTARFAKRTGLAAEYPDDTGPVRAGQAGRRGDCQGLRRLRFRQGDAADHGRGRPRQQVHRRPQAVGNRQERAPDPRRTRRCRTFAPSA